MKNEYYNFGEIVDKYFKLKIIPRYSGETIYNIYYLINQYLNTNTTQFLDSKFDFFKYSDYIEENLNLIYGPESVKIIYPAILVKRKPISEYEVAIFINWLDIRHKHMYLKFIKP